MGIDVLESAPEFIDNGNAPEFFANGLHDVEVMGAVCRLILFSYHRTGEGRSIKEPVFTCVIPVDAVGPAIALTLKRLASGILIPTASVGVQALAKLN